MKIPPHCFLSRSLREKPWGEKVTRILAAALAAVDPDTLIKDLLTRENNRLCLPGHEIDLESFSRIYLLGIGKAALSMSTSLEDLIGDQLTEGYILTKKGQSHLPESSLRKSRIFSGGHPVPDQDGLRATEEILDHLLSLNEDDLVIVLISGGSSALFTQPAEGISLADLRKTNHILLSCGADIRETNIIRKHLSRVKGGGLAKTLYPAQILTLILSDVIGDPVDMIGSGPTAPDPSTFSDALAVIDKYDLKDLLPETVRARLDQGVQGSLPETPKAEDPCFMNVINLILANNRIALEAGTAQAKAEGFSTKILPDPLLGEACAAGADLAHRLADLALEGNPLPRPACLITGGETTVTLTSIKKPGLGGRNLETALCALPLLDGLEDIALITLATDGEEGLTNSAGAVVTGESYQLCQKLGLDPETYLDNHDSYTLFENLDDLLLIGQTGTNVNDLCFMFTF
jgi:glycerate 2-kinase